MNSREVLIPRHQPEVAIDHHDAVAHAGQRRFENRPLTRDGLMAAAGGGLGAQQQQGQHRNDQRDAAGEQQRIRLPVGRREQGLVAIEADNHLQVLIRNRGESVHSIGIIQTRCAGPASLGRLAHRSKER